MRPFNNAVRGVTLGLVLAALAGCSETNEYLDRRDTIALGAGNAVATDKTTQMVDPWPPVSAQKSIGFNGERMETAMERYRTNRTYPPSGTGTSSTYAPPPPPNNTTPVGPTVAQPAAPVK